ncbi:BING4CT-domain-containing protein [Rickenella mellea]|uniref:U three protein 7 n=1 Tax=Rickenella mellea TaxID=50990 RepID=A0A4Y7PV63_9AGAM|nr:BING4CT-domain-containing protein [Rickenella mellea]
MDALIARADAIQPLAKRRRTEYTPGRSSHPTSHEISANGSETTKPAHPDPTAASISRNTALPASLRPTSPPPSSAHTHKHIKNKSLRLTLDRQSAHSARTKELIKDAELLTSALGAEHGRIEVDDEMEKTWRVGQKDIVSGAGQEAAKGRKEWVLDGGGYRARYTRNGRHLAIVGKTGHVATFDWQSGTMHAELQLRETCQDITFLHDHSHFAVAQNKYVFIYDQDGVELHRLSAHVEPTRLEFLPYHWLLASIGRPGFLKYTDTSTGQLVTSHRTKLGSCSTLAQNPHTAVLYLGHQNGQVTLWTPNLPHPAVRLLAHMGGVTGLSVDPSEEGGRYMATSGVDGRVKVWDCRNWKGAVREWGARGGGAEVEWSQRGSLAVASGGSVNIYNPPTIHAPHTAHSPPPLYMTHPIPHRPLSGLRFCPFQDILTVGHAKGLSSILVPGSGEPNFDSSEADPFETRKARREREVRGLLDKIQPDMISLDPSFIGSLAPPPKLTTTDGQPADIPFARLPRMERLKVQGKADETEENDDDDHHHYNDGGGDDDGAEAAKGPRKTKEEKEKTKMRGKGKSMKRFLRKKRKNVIDPAAVAIRAKLDKQREERRKAKEVQMGGDEGVRKPSALDRFKRKT